MVVPIDFEKIAGFLKGHNTIQFAVVFGSAVQGQLTKLSDIDIGIHTAGELPLLEMGRMISGLEKVVKKTVDLVVLNDLFKSKPYFAFQIVKNSRLLFTRDENTWVDFKRNVLLYYLDTKPLIERVNASFQKRVETGAFAERNYA